MNDTTALDIQTQIAALSKGGADRVGRLVDVILEEAVRRSASDVHFEPTHRRLTVRYPPGRRVAIQWRP